MITHTYAPGELLMTTQSAEGLRFSKLVGFHEDGHLAKWGAGDGRCENHLYTFICNLRGEPDVCICLGVAENWTDQTGSRWYGIVLRARDEKVLVFPDYCFEPCHPN